MSEFEDELQGFLKDISNQEKAFAPITDMDVRSMAAKLLALPIRSYLVLMKAMMMASREIEGRGMDQ